MALLLDQVWQRQRCLQIRIGVAKRLGQKVARCYSTVLAAEVVRRIIDGATAINFNRLDTGVEPLISGLPGKRALAWSITSVPISSPMSMTERPMYMDVLSSA